MPKKYIFKEYFIVFLVSISFFYFIMVFYEWQKHTEKFSLDYFKLSVVNDVELLPFLI